MAALYHKPKNWSSYFDATPYVRAKLPGFFSLRPTAAGGAPVQAGDWPTYRRDPARSGRAGTALAPKLRPGWETRLGGTLTAPVIAGGCVFLRHQVFDRRRHTPLARTPLPGTPVWDGMAAAGGRLFVATRDGRIVCLAR